ncbi:MAG: helix-turn-helix transcriptional regulator [Neisseria sp.]|jgi:AraC-like DNA-binding protein|nr:helix-turn-helix transcriptional regulator [Neisseria sp.]MBP8043112.1 helix-turn-helix transcriptional regulator [Neisseria sp.]MBP8045552.1 helix-turn-helix transcriptional regulator [Neisseria sp.]MBP8069257.1 helix-turn-helix transcriptional regulator [Neisseria sp.]MBP8875034.1 helix-turn-helix transcriptional regulator [Neisseria sp.]
MWRLRTEQTSFARLLRQLRMEAALFLLMSSQTLIGDVAAACGYQSGGHFAAAFKQQFGFLPSDVRT